MVKIENSVAVQPMLSARAAYKLIEGESKQPKNLQITMNKKKANKRKLGSDSLKENLLSKKKKIQQMDISVKKNKANVNVNSKEVEPQEKTNGNCQLIRAQKTKKLNKNKAKKQAAKLKKDLIQPKDLEAVCDIVGMLDVLASKKVKKLKKNLKSNEVGKTKQVKKVKAEKSLPVVNEVNFKPDTENKNILQGANKMLNIVSFVKANGSNDDEKINGIGLAVKQQKQATKLIKKKNLQELANKQMLKKQIIRTKKNVPTKWLNNFLIKLMRGKYDEKRSELLGAKIFEYIINPVTMKEFFIQNWEAKQLLIKGSKNKFRGILSTMDIDDMLRKNNLTYTKNIDITSYKDGKRETHNPEGRALASVVWDYFNSGCSIRLLNPQTFNSSVWKLLTNLQEYFNSFCGANVYLTPPGTQGFAPHWDDIEAFIIQLEGKKRWRVYKWRSEKDTLPRTSSGNFGPDDRLGEIVIDCVLEPGDLLYFPRGFIHQAEALEDTHSLHITISTYQKNSWVDLLEKLLPAALETAAEQHVEFREGLPRECFYTSGIAFSDIKSAVKDKISKKVNDLVMKMMEEAPLDAAIDQLAKGFIHDSLPPFLSEDEKARTIFEGGEKWSIETNNVGNQTELTPETTIRLLRRGCVRILVEEDSIRLFHTVENSREYHEEEPKFIEIAPDIAPGVEMLIHSYPNFVAIEDLPLSNLSDKMVLANGLWEKGLIIVEYPLESTDEELL